MKTSRGSWEWISQAFVAWLRPTLGNRQCYCDHITNVYPSTCQNSNKLVDLFFCVIYVFRWQDVCLGFFCSVEHNYAQMFIWKGSIRTISNNVSNAGRDYSCFQLCYNTLEWFVFLSCFCFGPVWPPTVVCSLISKHIAYLPAKYVYVIIKTSEM